MVCFLRTPSLSLQPFVPYPAIRKKSTSQHLIRSSVTAKQSLRNSSVFPALSQFGAIIVYTTVTFFVKREEHQLPPFQAGFFQCVEEEQQSPLIYLGSKFVNQIVSPAPLFFRLTFRDLHDLPHLCPKGTGMCAGIISVIVTWMGELLNKY